MKNRNCGHCHTCGSLTLDRLDMQHQTIKLTETKSNRDRTIVFSGLAADRLACWLEIRKGLNVPAGVAHCFVSSFSNSIPPHALTANGMRQILKNWQKEAGIERFNFHGLRHCFAVYSLRARAELMDIQKQMGHTNIATTARYLLVDDEGRQERHQSRNPFAYLNIAA